MRESPATSKVFREMQKEHPDYYMQVVGERLRGVEASPETFPLAAVRWLGDRSELSTAEIESADWIAVYKYFKEYSE
ncbi:hypothetical protein [Streptomyces sp. NPDC056883]|uniref:hypothetical protein n=1 Tax=Streptomyces sp. NPDC056883 TaxID=3345959 RepID=UPI00369D4C35